MTMKYNELSLFGSWIRNLHYLFIYLFIYILIFIFLL